MWMLERKTELDDGQAHYAILYKNMELDANQNLPFPRRVICIKSANSIT